MSNVSVVVYVTNDYFNNHCFIIKLKVLLIIVFPYKFLFLCGGDTT